MSRKFEGSERATQGQLPDAIAWAKNGDHVFLARPEDLGITAADADLAGNCYGHQPSELDQARIELAKRGLKLFATNEGLRSGTHDEMIAALNAAALQTPES